MDIGSFACPYQSDFDGGDWNEGGGDWNEGTGLWSLERRYRTPQEQEGTKTVKTNEGTGWNEVVRSKAGGRPGIGESREDPAWI